MKNMEESQVEQCKDMENKDNNKITERTKGKLKCEKIWKL